jgi:hypothetical protein
MARENFLWGAPRIHGELLMLGFTVSQEARAIVDPAIRLMIDAACPFQILDRRKEPRFQPAPFFDVGGVNPSPH